MEGVGGGGGNECGKFKMKSEKLKAIFRGVWGF